MNMLMMVAAVAVVNGGGDGWWLQEHRDKGVIFTYIISLVELNLIARTVAKTNINRFHRNGVLGMRGKERRGHGHYAG